LVFTGEVRLERSSVAAFSGSRIRNPGIPAGFLARLVDHIEQVECDLAGAGVFDRIRAPLARDSAAGVITATMTRRALTRNVVARLVCKR
jgi:hypothetical protein